MVIFVAYFLESFAWTKISTWSIEELRVIRKLSAGFLSIGCISPSFIDEFVLSTLFMRTLNEFNLLFVFSMRNNGMDKIISPDIRSLGGNQVTSQSLNLVNSAPHLKPHNSFGLFMWSMEADWTGEMG